MKDSRLLGKILFVLLSACASQPPIVSSPVSSSQPQVELASNQLVEPPDGCAGDRERLGTSVAGVGTICRSSRDQFPLFIKLTAEEDGCRLVTKVYRGEEEVLHLNTLASEIVKKGSAYHLSTNQENFVCESVRSEE